MVLTTPVWPDATVTVVPIATTATDHVGAISMLLARGEFAPGDADRLATNPSALDELMMLCTLHDQNDLSDADFRFEKGEILRQTGALSS